MLKTKDVLIMAGGVWGFISDVLYSDLTFNNPIVLFPSRLVLGVVEALGVSGMPSIGYTLLTVIAGGLAGLLAGYALTKVRK